MGVWRWGKGTIWWFSQNVLSWVLWWFSYLFFCDKDFFSKSSDDDYNMDTIIIILSLLFILDTTPCKLTWNPKMKVWKMISLFKHVIFRFHVNFRGCTRRSAIVIKSSWFVTFWMTPNDFGLRITGIFFMYPLSLVKSSWNDLYQVEENVFKRNKHIPSLKLT